MKKHPIPILLLLCTALLIGGTAVAYCNTRSFGFEPNAKWITYDEAGFTVYDFQVEYSQLAEVWHSLLKFFPKESQTCALRQNEFSMDVHGFCRVFSLPVYNVYK